MNRLKRIEGQVRGIQGMLEKDAYCIDILVQVSAINAALNSFNKKLLANHIETCVAENIREGHDDAIQLTGHGVHVGQADEQRTLRLFHGTEERIQ